MEAKKIKTVVAHVVGSRVEDLVANPNPFRRGENPDG